MSSLDDAKSAQAQASQALDAANLVVADLENESTTGGGVVEYTAQSITNADGSIVITLTPTTAPATVSDTAEAGSGGGIPLSPAGGAGSPEGIVTTDTGPEVAGPGPTGQ
jgi:hypothetical protein